jgi:hypothetical protein
VPSSTVINDWLIPRYLSYEVDIWDSFGAPWNRESPGVGERG